MNNAMSPNRALAVALAMATALSSSVALAQVPVIDGARVKIQTQTMDWYTTYEADTKKVKGASGGTTESVAPGQGSGSPMDCSAEGMSGDTTRAPAAKRTHSQQEIARMVEEEAIRQGVDPNFAMAIAEQESRFRQSARSGVGAIGVMQLMPGTAAELDVNPYDTRDNIRGGVKYIKKLQGMFGNRTDLVAAGYNAGPYRQSLLNGRVPNIPETQDYVKKVSGYYNQNKAHNGDRAPQGGSTPDPETVGYNQACGEPLKKALDRNTEAQLERGKIWNEFVQKSTEANQQYLQRLQAGLTAASAGLRSSGAGGDKGFGDGSLVMPEVQCPTAVFNTGGTRCYAVPSPASTKDIQGWLMNLQEQARLKGEAATFSVMEDPALGLVTVVDNRPIAQ
ncbi:lytic transglycosylase domain-containing protein [Mesorhizobium shangrilense]|uniref:Lytic transglycosylase domain-containing protein n=1 Tax=Mesorhizobium shangrilense TaxID=460060 RepID=A0ABV2DQD3_9HYPH